ncbi:response regulator [Dyadobacter sandarakinus]|uniref:Response regulator n=1 Tax=Dyadobacter sandarakinus TaxID=2747268 RepID=A0ABX7I2P1_9BACT|nr:response regulator [Dyadobacter sandarakinus]QRR00324.1 response regulator [Dyadobacter sandarakinus]
MSQREVYFVDDDPDQRKMLRELFKACLPGYTIRFFDSGQALYLHLVAISADNYNGPLPGLLLMDLHMPGIDGYNLLKLVRHRINHQNINWSKVPVVIFTNFVTGTQINECYEAGANSVMVKPLKADDLMDMMNVTCKYWLQYNHL